MERKKTKIATVALVLLLTASTLIMVLPITTAQLTPINFSFYYEYETIGLNQVNRFAVEPPSSVFNTPPYDDEPDEWPDAYAIFTRPDDTTITVNGPFRVDWVRRRLIYFDVEVDQLGEWTVVFIFPGDATYAPSSVEGQFTVVAEQVPKRVTHAFLNIRPETIGRGQELLINAWITPRAILPGDWYQDYYFIFTKPDGSTDTIGPRDAYGEGSTWFNYSPDQLGEWTVQFTWDGDIFELGAQTAKQPFTVQEEPIPSWPPAPLPTEPLDPPVNPENREWASIMGPYLMPTGGSGLGYDSTGQRFNPYSLGPNTAHINWMLPPTSGEGGLVGGQYGQILTYSGTAPYITVVMAGRAYYQSGGMIYCLDVRTGKQLWATPGFYSFGLIEGTDPLTQRAELVNIGVHDTVPARGPLKLVKYDAITGDVLLDMTIDESPGSMYTMLAMDYQYAYVAEIPAGNNINFGPGNLMKIDILGTGTGNRIVYDVPYTLGGLVDIGVCLYGDVLTSMHFGIFGDSGGINTTTGEVLWSGPIEDVVGGTIEAKPEHVTSANGVEFININLGYWVALDMATGDIIWTSEQADYPWGNFWAYGHSTAYGNLYGLAYDGVYAFDQTTGNIKWHYSAGDSGLETPYNTWPFGSVDPVVADGKVYAPTSEHSPQIYYRGQRLHCINADTGGAVWSIMGYYRADCIAEGTLFAYNEYDKNAYAFAKGESATTVSVISKVIAKGSSVLIEGTVMDLSPAQPNTPAISDASMSRWMEYLHMQQPLPMDATGVEVLLATIDTNGNYVEIGRTTTNTDGKYGLAWTPELEGTYQIVATFEGSESYYASYDTTYLAVGPAPPTGGPIEPEPEAPLITTEVAIIATVAIIAIIGLGTYWYLRKRGPQTQ